MSEAMCDSRQLALYLLLTLTLLSGCQEQQPSSLDFGEADFGAAAARYQSDGSFEGRILLRTPQGKEPVSIRIQWVPK